VWAIYTTLLINFRQFTTFRSYWYGYVRLECIKKSGKFHSEMQNYCWENTKKSSGDAFLLHPLCTILLFFANVDCDNKTYFIFKTFFPFWSYKNNYTGRRDRQTVHKWDWRMVIVKYFVSCSVQFFFVLSTVMSCFVQSQLNSSLFVTKMTSHDHLRQGITGVARLRKLLWLPDNAYMCRWQQVQ